MILVLRGQKIVANPTAGLRRIYEYCLPLEERLARHNYDVRSGVNNILIINHVTTPGRLTAILVNRTLGIYFNSRKRAVEGLSELGNLP